MLISLLDPAPFLLDLKPARPVRRSQRKRRRLLRRLPHAARRRRMRTR